MLNNQQNFFKLLIESIGGSIEQIKNIDTNKLTLVIGNSGAGKSLFIDAAIGCKLQKIENPNMPTYYELVEKDDKACAPVDKTSDAVTLYPEVYASKNDPSLKFCDTPGLQHGGKVDSFRVIASLNMQILHCLMEKIKIIIVINAGHLNTDRDAVLWIIESIAKLFVYDPDVINDTSDVNPILFVFNDKAPKASGITNEFVKNKINETISSEKNKSAHSLVPLSEEEKKIEEMKFKLLSSIENNFLLIDNIIDIKNNIAIKNFLERETYFNKKSLDFHGFDSFNANIKSSIETSIIKNTELLKNYGAVSLELDNIEKEIKDTESKINNLEKDILEKEGSIRREENLRKIELGRIEADITSTTSLKEKAEKEKKKKKEEHEKATKELNEIDTNTPVTILVGERNLVDCWSYYIDAIGRGAVVSVVTTASVFAAVTSAPVAITALSASIAATGAALAAGAGGAAVGTGTAAAGVALVAEVGGVAVGAGVAAAAAGGAAAGARGVIAGVGATVAGAALVTAADAVTTADTNTILASSTAVGIVTTSVIAATTDFILPRIIYSFEYDTLSVKILIEETNKESGKKEWKELDKKVPIVSDNCYVKHGKSNMPQPCSDVGLSGLIEIENESEYSNGLYKKNYEQISFPDFYKMEISIDIEKRYYGNNPNRIIELIKKITSLSDEITNLTESIIEYAKKIKELEAKKKKFDDKQDEYSVRIQEYEQDIANYTEEKKEHVKELKNWSEKKQNKTKEKDELKNSISERKSIYETLKNFLENEKFTQCPKLLESFSESKLNKAFLESYALFNNDELKISSESTIKSTNDKSSNQPKEDKQTEKTTEKNGNSYNIGRKPLSIETIEMPSSEIEDEEIVQTSDALRLGNPISSLVVFPAILMREAKNLLPSFSSTCTDVNFEQTYEVPENDESIPSYQSSITEQLPLLQLGMYYLSSWLPWNKVRKLTDTEAKALREHQYKFDEFYKKLNEFNESIIADCGLFEEQLNWLDNTIRAVKLKIKSTLNKGEISQSQWNEFIHKMANIESELSKLDSMQEELLTLESKSVKLAAEGKRYAIGYDFVNHKLKAKIEIIETGISIRSPAWELSSGTLFGHRQQFWQCTPTQVFEELPVQSVEMRKLVK